MKFSKFLTFALATVLLLSCSGNKQTSSESEEAQQEQVKQKPTLPEGALSGVFSISASKQIRFAQGNLQYLPATKKWQFAKHQYDYVGLSNEDISDNYDGWIDVFGWGTSGWNNGGNAYMPTATGSTPMSWGNSNYGPQGNNYGDNDLTGKYANADWGVYNAISNGGGQPNLWRTLTAAEWEYLLFKRPNALQLLALGSIGGINGLFIMPDDFEEENMFSTLGDRNYEYETFKHDGKCFYSKYSDYWSSFQKTDMKELNELGIVFLPAAGSRDEKSMSAINTYGRYWTATRGKTIWNYQENHTEVAAAMIFQGEGVFLYNDVERSYGYAVRLVQDIVE